MNYLISIILISFVILVHEAGHYIAARKAGIPIRVFSIGFGPKLFSVKRGDTEYRISIIPIGGYVLPEIEEEEEFFKIPVYKRAVMAAGGPLASAILPVICFCVINVIISGISLENVIIKPFVQTLNVLGVMLMSLTTMFSHTEQLSGIVGIVAQGGQLIGINPLNGLQYVALLSLNLAILNMLPIPALDGGKLLLYALEKIHPRFLKLHFPLAVIGWVLILGMTVYVTVGDIGKYIMGMV